MFTPMQIPDSQLMDECIDVPDAAKTVTVQVYHSISDGNRMKMRLADP